MTPRVGAALNLVELARLASSCETSSVRSRDDSLETCFLPTSAKRLRLPSDFGVVEFAGA